MGGCVGKVSSCLLPNLCFVLELPSDFYVILLSSFGQGRSIVEEKLDFKGGNVHVITTKEDWDQKIEEANKDGKIVVANFSASWCGPCRVIAPVYAEMSKTYPQLMFLTIDVDDLMDFSSTWDIRATPTFFFLKNGQQIDKLVGANKPELEKKVQALGDGS
ncbi:thioredoxin H4-2 isoform X1 [Triticum aestivum]|uniref:Thioredoxin domain-containing protein n=3 Tax=Pooideae TaxID=147368 RepID=A0A452Y3P2_AEGTS|nr:thioredoxin H4-2 isoform X1 [Triticum aestivum]